MLTGATRDFLAQLVSDGITTASARLTPLTGGVSSEIYRIEQPGRPPCVVKRALPQLRVRDAWLADLSRNAFEQKYLAYVGAFLPSHVPKVLATGDGYFVMELLGDGFVNWKAELLAGKTSVAHAITAGEVLGAIHGRSRGDATAAADFASTSNFIELRIDPYLHTIAKRHPEIHDVVQAEAARLAAARECLVHGDYSPKNVLLAHDRWVLLDCEVAWYGDPVFDIAFLLNHLLLKAAHFAPRELGFLTLAEAFVASYARSNGSESPTQVDLECRTARLLAMLLLARIDGKSPVEYLAPEKRDFVRRTALGFIRSQELDKLPKLLDQWGAALKVAFPPSHGSTLP